MKLDGIITIFRWNYYIDSSLDLDGILGLSSGKRRLCVNLLEDTPYTPQIKYETQERPSQVVN